MHERKHTDLVVGLVLILVGLFLTAWQFVPEFRIWFVVLDWPLYVIGLGGILFILGLLANMPGLSVPACMVMGAGAIFYWQKATGRWDSWSYAWPLLVSSMGMGMILSGLLGIPERRRRLLINGLQWIVVGLVLFFLFDALFGMHILGPYWPMVLVAVGLWLLIRTFLRDRG
mgnify:CR=1 FL=1